MHEASNRLLPSNQFSLISVYRRFQSKEDKSIDLFNPFIIVFAILAFYFTNLVISLYYLISTKISERSFFKKLCLLNKIKKKVFIVTYNEVYLRKSVLWFYAPFIYISLWLMWLLISEYPAYLFYVKNLRWGFVLCQNRIIASIIIKGGKWKEKISDKLVLVFW